MQNTLSAVFAPQFEKLCVDILARAHPDLQVVEQHDIVTPEHNRLKVDIVGYIGREVEFVAEVKVYRSLAVPTSWLLTASDALSRGTGTLRPNRRLLVVSARLSAHQRDVLTRISVETIDFDDLYRLAGGHEDLVSRLDALLGLAVETGSAQVEIRAVGTTSAQQASSEPITYGQIYANASASIVSRGDALCKELRQVNPGRPAAATFERAVKACLEYIFEGQLGNWTNQRTNADKLRSDIAAKVIGQHDFWRDLIRDFNTRFVLFECKNHSKAFTQEQVYSTEKYLFRAALRSVAIFISPHGADKGARTAMKGALREAGKLMLSLTTRQLCEMLTARDEGGEVHAILAQQLDDMLLEISR